MFKDKISILLALIAVSIIFQAQTIPAKKQPTKAPVSAKAPVVAKTPTAKKKNDGAPFQFRNGDLLFQQLQCGELCDAIHNVTTGVRKANFSHVAILVIKPNDMYVIEAIDKNVHRTPLELFLHRSIDKSGNPLVAVGRLRNNDSQLAEMAVMNAEQFIGRPYNDAYDWGSPNMYCSQLVLKSYSVNGVTVFPAEIQPMTFMDPKTHKPDKEWVKYFDKLGIPLPEGKPGCNPGALSRDNQLTMYFPFSPFN